MAEPLFRALKKITRARMKKERRLIVLFSASGRPFDAKTAALWARTYDRIVMIAGRYEGVDARVQKMFPMREISIGPYVLTGGELAALIVVDAVSRHIPGVLGSAASIEERRHGVGVPAYTRPEVLEHGGKKFRVPKVLLSGDRKMVSLWRQPRGK